MARYKKRKSQSTLIVMTSLVLSIFLVYKNSFQNNESNAMETVPVYNGDNYEVINNNIPEFKESDYELDTFESYSELDSLGRCGVAFASINKSLMPTEERGSIGMIKPSGWHTVKYDHISGKYLYNRCHLIGYQLTGENANEKNLITCTRSMNTVGMLSFENQVADYLKENDDNVLYRVTPVFQGDNLLANGVQIEAASVSDHCGKICFNVFVYNVEDKVEIDYKTGESSLKEENES